MKAKTKDTQMNPKDLIGMTKLSPSVVSQTVMAEVSVGIMEGALKYGRHNTRVMPIGFSVYYDATRRHMDRWWEGEDIDKDSGLNHITKAIASLVVLRDAMIQGTVKDDRPPVAPAGFFDEINVVVKNLLAKYPNPVAPYTEVGEAAKER